MYDDPYMLGDAGLGVPEPSGSRADELQDDMLVDTKTYTVLRGDCVALMDAMPENSIDAVVCDPPYGLEFMGREWDKLWTKRDKATADLSGKSSSPFVAAAVEKYIGGETAERWHERWARAALRVLKPGGYLAAFGGTRVYHRLVCALEDAGFEIRDCLMWNYSTGFPKSLDVSKAIDKVAGVERDVVGVRTDGCGNTVASIHKQEGFAASRESTYEETAPASAAAREWSGWGTALKPAWEPIVLARKPVSEASVAANVLKWGTGALNIAGCRIGTCGAKVFAGFIAGADTTSVSAYGDGLNGKRTKFIPKGRWPANFVLSHAPECVEVGTRQVKSANGPADYTPTGKQGHTSVTTNVKTGAHFGDSDGLETVAEYACVPGCPVRTLDDQSGQRKGMARIPVLRRGSTTGKGMGYTGAPPHDSVGAGYGDTGASRFFYSSKAPQSERWGYCKACAQAVLPNERKLHGEGHEFVQHPTVKPVALMRWLCRLVAPSGAVILDPFGGSGSTGAAALAEGQRVVLCEQDDVYANIIEARLTSVAWKVENEQTK